MLKCKQQLALIGEELEAHADSAEPFLHLDNTRLALRQIGGKLAGVLDSSHELFRAYVRWHRRAGWLDGQREPPIVQSSAPMVRGGGGFERGATRCGDAERVCQLVHPEFVETRRERVFVEQVDLRDV